jgi:hypothetical protein
MSIYWKGYVWSLGISCYSSLLLCHSLTVHILTSPLCLLTSTILYVHIPAHSSHSVHAYLWLIYLYSEESLCWFNSACTQLLPAADLWLLYPGIGWFSRCSWGGNCVASCRYWDWLLCHYFRNCSMTSSISLRAIATLTMTMSLLCLPQVLICLPQLPVIWYECLRG